MKNRWRTRDENGENVFSAIDVPKPIKGIIKHAEISGKPGKQGTILINEEGKEVKLTEASEILSFATKLMNKEGMNETYTHNVSVFVSNCLESMIELALMKPNKTEYTFECSNCRATELFKRYNQRKTEIVQSIRMENNNLTEELSEFSDAVDLEYICYCCGHSTNCETLQQLLKKGFLRVKK